MHRVPDARPDLGAARGSLRDAGWVVEDTPDPVARAGHFVALVASLTGVVLLWVVPPIGVALGLVAAVVELGSVAAFATPLRLPRALVRSERSPCPGTERSPVCEPRHSLCSSF